MNNNEYDYEIVPLEIPEEVSETKVVNIAPQESIEEEKTIEEVKPDKEDEESYLKSFFRYMYQPISGFMQMNPYALLMEGMSAWSTAESLQALDELEERLPELKRKFPNAPWPEKIDKEKFKENLQMAQRTYPTLSNIERGVEQLTGLPLEAKTKGQQLARLSGSGFKLTPGDISQRTLGAVGTVGAEQALEAFGVPEQIAEPVSLLASQIPKPSAIKGVQKIRGRSTPSQIERQAITGIPPGEPPGSPPPNIPPTSFQTAEEIQSLLSAEENAALEQILKNQPPEPLGGIRPKSIQRGGRALEGRVAPTTQDLGIRPAPAPRKQPSDLKSTLLDSVNPYEIYNKSDTGRSIQRIVRDIDNEAYQNVNNIYNISRNLNENVVDIHPQMAERLNDMAENLRNIPQPSSVQRQLLNSIENILQDIAPVQEGVIMGYQPINNQILIDQIQSLRQAVDFDFAHGQPKNIFRPLINDLSEGVINAAQRTGNIEAAEALINAETAYRDWTTRFNNDYINPYRDISNRDYQKLFNKMLDIDEFNVMNDVIGETQAGNRIMQATRRDLVEKEMKNILDNPRNISQRELERKFREMQTYLEPEQIERLRNEIEQYRRRFPREVRVVKMPEKVTPDLKAIQKYTNYSPEKIENMMNSRSGIKELKNKLSTTDQGTKLFNKIRQQKIQDIIRGGKVKKEYTGKDIYEILNEKKNYNLMEELTSPEETKVLHETAKEIADRKFTRENIEKFGKQAGKRYAKYKLLKILLNYI